MSDLSGLAPIGNYDTGSLSGVGSYLNFIQNSFGTTLDNVFNYFRTYQFLNLIMSVIVGSFVLKFNVFIFKQTKFKSMIPSQGYPTA